MRPYELKTGLTLLALCALTGAERTAQAQVMDFNTLPIGNTYSSYSESGITLTADDANSTFDTTLGAGGTTGASFHETSPGGPMGGPQFGTSFTFSKGGTPFDLLSINILSGGGAPVEYLASNGSTFFTASAGLTTFGSGFANITSFQQITTANRTSFVIIDDVTLGAASVPEPSALAGGLALSLTALLALRRRRS